MKTKPAVLALSCLAALSCTTAPGALAADVSPFGELLSPVATHRLHAPFEARLGGFAHEPGGPESGSVDLSAEVVFGRVAATTNDWWNFSAMRAHVGGTFNTAAKTNGIYAGPIWTFALTDRIFVEASIDGAWNDGMTGFAKPVGRAGMGCHFGFHESASIGYNINDRWSVMATAEHYSNLNMCARNHGVSNYGLRIGYAF